MSTLNFNIDMLEWAANNIGLRLDQVVSKISEAERTQKKLLAGEFSVNQAESFADITKVPFGTLFLDTPPKALYKPSIPDLRQKQNPEPLSDSFYEVLEDIQRKQEWYIEYLTENGFKKLEFVGKYQNTRDLNAEIIASDIRKVLNLPIQLKTKTNRENYLKLLIERCENAGILVFRNSMVKNATKKQLDTSEFRGFVLIDKYAPAIFLNMQDMPSAIIFTLAHELAHIWLGESAVDDLDIYGNNPIEILCNKIAAAILVSRKEFIKAWMEHEGDFLKIADHFYVSKLMIARLALTYEMITKEHYNSIHKNEHEAFKKLPKKEGTPKFINMVPGRNSPKLTKVIVNQALSGNMLLRDAGKLLNVSPQNIMKLGGSN
ncbi:MAG TPA: hypothetical protein DIC32_00785 [Acinetobacter radioresistens]|uniref:IrrE N-terminal-like domain-containing protein n=1 Tax=Acinetobacter radioresistens TaxID=40216 RepID=A0A3D3FZJ0_ACIRA|nr:hypothetical protein [Acinetobacter radioresistens]